MSAEVVTEFQATNAAPPRDRADCDFNAGCDDSKRTNEDQRLWTLNLFYCMMG